MKVRDFTEYLVSEMSRCDAGSSTGGYESIDYSFNLRRRSRSTRRISRRRPASS
jgi:hypothetical protein